MQINMDKKRIEKWILRRAFDDEEKPYLPKVFFMKINSGLELQSTIF